MNYLKQPHTKQVAELIVKQGRAGSFYEKFGKYFLTTAKRKRPLKQLVYQQHFRNEYEIL